MGSMLWSFGLVAQNLFPSEHKKKTTGSVGSFHSTGKGAAAGDQRTGAALPRALSPKRLQHHAGDVEGHARKPNSDRERARPPPRGDGQHQHLLGDSGGGGGSRQSGAASLTLDPLTLDPSRGTCDIHDNRNSGGKSVRWNCFVVWVAYEWHSQCLWKYLWKYKLEFREAVSCYLSRRSRTQSQTPEDFSF